MGGLVSLSSRASVALANSEAVAPASTRMMLGVAAPLMRPMYAGSGVSNTLGSPNPNVAPGAT